MSCDPADYAPAIRQTPPQAAGLWGLPTAPDELDDCAEVAFYRLQWGLPDRFDRLAWRESRCTNTPISRTGCCVGIWQLHRIIFTDHRMLDRVAACEANWWNVRGDDPLSKQRQACVTAALFMVAGYQPWNTGG